MQDLKTLLVDDSETKIKIFESAAKLFAEKGYNGVSMREISAKSGVSKPTIYYYFESKEEIYKTLIRFGLRYGLDRSKEIIELDIPAKDKLIKLIQNRFRISYQHPEFSKFFMIVFDTLERLPFLDEFEKLADEHRNMLIKLIEEGVNSGEFGAGANPQMAVHIVGAVVGYFVREQLKTKKKILTDELAEEIVELLFKGLNE